jgi:hypothetical protein
MIMVYPLIFLDPRVFFTNERTASYVVQALMCLWQSIGGRQQ